MVDFQSIQKNWSDEQSQLNNLGKVVVEFIRDGLSSYELLPEISYRTKELISIIKKIKKKQKEKEYTYADLTDRLGIRVICMFLCDLDKIDNFLCSSFLIKKIEKKIDSIDFNKLDYQSNHYDVSIDFSNEVFSDFLSLREFVFEIQVRTLNQHAWSNSAHTLIYKQEIDMPSIMKRKIYRLLSIYEIADEEFATVNNFLQEQPDNFVYTLIRKLEGKIYKYAKTDFDRETSIENFGMLIKFFNSSELCKIANEIESFISSNDEKIKVIYTENHDYFHEKLFLTQPEIFLIWYGIENFEFSITDNWRDYSDEFELEQISSLWGRKI